MKFDLKALWEALKEPLRWAVLGVIPYALTYFGGLSAWWAVAVTVILRVIDAYLHEHAPKGEAGGLVRF